MDDAVRDPCAICGRSLRGYGIGCGEGRVAHHHCYDPHLTVRRFAVSTAVLIGLAAIFRSDWSALDTQVVAAGSLCGLLATVGFLVASSKRSLWDLLTGGWDDVALWDIAASLLIVYAVGGSLLYFLGLLLFSGS